LIWFRLFFFFLVIPGLEWRIVIMTRVSCVGDHTLYIKKRKKKTPFHLFNFSSFPWWLYPLGVNVMRARVLSYLYFLFILRIMTQVFNLDRARADPQLYTFWFNTILVNSYHDTYFEWVMSFARIKKIYKWEKIVSFANDEVHT